MEVKDISFLGWQISYLPPFVNSFFTAGRKKDKYGVITLDDEPWNRRWAAKIATDEEYFRELERTNPGQARNTIMVAFCKEKSFVCREGKLVNSDWGGYCSLSFLPAMSSFRSWTLENFF